jgi:hypothetical protein
MKLKSNVEKFFGQPTDSPNTPKIICVQYGERLSSDDISLDVTSRVKSPFSPLLLRTPNGIMENVWQFSKVYPEHVDDNGEIKDEWFRWRENGLNSRWAILHPMGKDARPLFFIWEDKKLQYIEARKKIYIPVYSNAVLDNSLKEFDTLVECWNCFRDNGYNLYLRDFDGYNRYKFSMSLDDVINRTSKQMGHSFVLEKMILSGQ